MLEKLKSAGTVVGGLAVMVGLLAVSFALMAGFMRGAQWLVENVLQWVFNISWLVLAFDILILLPMAIFRRLRSVSAVLLLLSSYLFGLATWLYGFAFTFGLWGGFAVVIGLFMMGVGVVFMGILATAFKGMWEPCLTLVVLIVMTFGMRMFSMWLGEHA